MSEENFIPFSSSYHFWGVVKIRQTKPNQTKMFESNMTCRLNTWGGKYMAV